MYQSHRSRAKHIQHDLHTHTDLTLCLKCLIVCLYAHLNYYIQSLVLYIPGWDFSHSEAATQVFLQASMICCGISPTRSPSYAVWIFPFRVSASQLRWWDFSHSEANANPTLLQDFPSWRPNSAVRTFPTQRKYLQVVQMGIFPLGNRTTFILDHSQAHPEQDFIKAGQHSTEAGSSELTNSWTTQIRLI